VSYFFSHFVVEGQNIRVLLDIQKIQKHARKDNVGNNWEVPTEENITDAFLDLKTHKLANRYCKKVKDIRKLSTSTRSKTKSAKQVILTIYS
jgi:hypothetical protein